MQSRALLIKENRTAQLAAHQNTQHQKKWTQHYKDRQRQQDIQQPFHILCIHTLFLFSKYLTDKGDNQLHILRCIFDIAGQADTAIENILLNAPAFLNLNEIAVCKNRL